MFKISDSETSAFIDYAVDNVTRFDCRKWDVKTRLFTYSISCTECEFIILKLKFSTISKISCKENIMN